MIPQKYVPNSLSNKDKKLQRNMLKKSRKLYKDGKYFTRRKVKSFKSKILLAICVIKKRKVPAR